MIAAVFNERGRDPIGLIQSPPTTLNAMAEHRWRPLPAPVWINNGHL